LDDVTYEILENIVSEFKGRISRMIIFNKFNSCMKKIKANQEKIKSNDEEINVHKGLKLVGISKTMDEVISEMAEELKKSAAPKTNEEEFLENRKKLEDLHKKYGHVSVNDSDSDGEGSEAENFIVDQIVTSIGNDVFG